MTIALTVFQGRAGDRNGLGVPGAAVMGAALSHMLGHEPTVIGTPEAAPYLGWRDELEAAAPGLRALSSHFDKLLFSGAAPITALPRCTTALATIPVIARRYPEACIIWFDAHADVNTPETSSTGYLGGMVLTAAAGLWDSGLGTGLALDNLILAGVRDIDGPEQNLIDQRKIPALAPEQTATDALRRAIAGRPVYMHIDCDVLDPSLVPTEYKCPNGLTFAQLHQACAIIAEGEVLGLEIAEFQDREHKDAPAFLPQTVLDALSPVIDRIRQRP